MAYRFIYLVRHGQYVQKKQDGGELTKRGILQARLTAESLRGLPFDRIVTSTILRAAQTTKIILDEFPDKRVHPSDLLREGVPSLPPSLSKFYTMNQYRKPPSGDEIYETMTRFDKAYTTFFTPALEEDQYDLLVCHGNIIRYFVTRTLQVDLDVWVRMAIYNCGITLILVDAEGESSLISHNDAGHLPYELRTHS